MRRAQRAQALIRPTAQASRSASPVALSEAQVAALQAALTKRTGAAIQLQRTVDPALIAGLVVTIGDRVIDASARTALESLRESMAGV